MENREAIEALRDLLDTTREYPHLDGMTLFGDAIDIAISALEKQEQSNTQNINSTHRSCPNALESLNILEQAKDDKGRVPMSLVRQAFRNVIEQDKWISCKERLPENKKKVLVSYDTEDGKKVDVSMFDKYGCLLGLVSAWRPLPEPYTEEES